MTDDEFIKMAADTLEESMNVELTDGEIDRLIALARIGASVMPRPRLSMEMLASLEETWEAMEAVGEDPKDATALRALLDWHYNFSTPQVKP